MLKFFKESIKEFDHVVWPTNKETKSYFTSVTSIIVALAIILFLAWTLFSQLLFTAKNIINPSKTTTQSSDTKNSDIWTLSWINLGNIQTETKTTNSKTK